MSQFKHSWMILITLLVLLIGIGLRFHGLEQKLLWHDEVYTLSRISGFQHKEVFDGIHVNQIQTPAQLLRFQHPTPGRGWNEIWQAILEHSEHSPLYYVLAALAAQIMPASSVLAVRGTSALLSLLLFPAAFWLAWEWSRQRFVAWVMLALVATSPLHLLYAQEARQYALLTALIVAASAALLRALNTQKQRDWIIYAVILILGFYTHLLFMQVIFAHVLYLIWTTWQQPTTTSWRNLYRAILVYIATFIAFAPWLWVMWQRFDQVQSFTSWMGQRLVGLSYLANSWLGHVNHVFVDLPVLEKWWAVGTVTIVIMLGYGLRHANNSALRFLFCLLVPSLLISFIPDILFGGVRSKETRYLLQPLIGLELAMAWTLAEFMTHTAAMSLRRGIANAAFVGMLLLGFISQWAISQADTWWSKSLSADNAAFAKLINAEPRPLVLAMGRDISAGELISLSYHLKPTIPILAQLGDETSHIAPGYSKIFLLVPSDKLKAGLKAKDYRISGYSWKWFMASRVAKNEKGSQPISLLFDTFDSNYVDNNNWYIPTWRSHDDGTLVGRTRFRCTQDHPALPRVINGNVMIDVESYNPLGLSFYGTDLISKQAFTIGTGLNLKVRAKMNSPAQPGTVAGIFLFARKSDTNTLHDEIDFELLGTNPQEVSTNIYANELLGDGHPLAFPYSAGSIEDYHIYEIQWLPNKVSWLVDGKVIRTDTNNVPTGPMNLHLNMWVPYKTWVKAHSASIQPTAAPEQNQIFTLSVDWVVIESL